MQDISQIKVYLGSIICIKVFPLLNQATDKDLFRNLKSLSAQGRKFGIFWKEPWCSIVLAV